MIQQDVCGACSLRASYTADLHPMLHRPQTYWFKISPGVDYFRRTGGVLNVPVTNIQTCTNVRKLGSQEDGVRRLSCDTWVLQWGHSNEAFKTALWVEFESRANAKSHCRVNKEQLRHYLISSSHHFVEIWFIYEQFFNGFFWNQ